MRRFLLAVALTCAVSSAVLAGSIPTSDVKAPEPPETAGNVPTGDLAQPVSPEVEMILTLIGILF